MNQIALLNTAQAASFLGVSKSFLERDRIEAALVPFIRIGKRTVRYRIDDLEAYVSRRIQAEPDEYPEM